ncbi:putative serine/threonine-protein kinase [Dictyocoela muelleri]|nr:putative serine/threonine-protein kinase [Dictyocoela muelleri]
MEKYKIINFIGEGGTSKVYSAINKNTNQKVAIKIIDKQRHTLSAHNEIIINKKLSHKYIVRMIDYYETNSKFYLIFEYLDNLQLRINLISRNVKKVIRMILIAIEYIHSRGIMHRDIKLSNMYIKDGIVKIGDFGLACDLKTHHTYCGTVPFLAPEVVNREYNQSIDIYGVGVVMKIILKENKMLIDDKDAYLELKNMFLRNSKNRISIKDALKHRFFNSLYPKVPFFILLPDFQRKTKFGIVRKTGNTVIFTYNNNFYKIENKEKDEYKTDKKYIGKDKNDDCKKDFNIDYIDKNYNDCKKDFNIDYIDNNYNDCKKDFNDDYIDKPYNDDYIDKPYNDDYIDDYKNKIRTQKKGFINNNIYQSNHENNSNFNTQLRINNVTISDFIEKISKTHKFSNFCNTDKINCMSLINDNFYEFSINESVIDIYSADNDVLKIFSFISEIVAIVCKHTKKMILTDQNVTFTFYIDHSFEVKINDFTVIERCYDDFIENSLEFNQNFIKNTKFSNIDIFNRGVKTKNKILQLKKLAFLLDKSIKWCTCVIPLIGNITIDDSRSFNPSITKNFKIAENMMGMTGNIRNKQGITTEIENIDIFSTQVYAEPQYIFYNNIWIIRNRLYFNFLFKCGIRVEADGYKSAYSIIVSDDRKVDYENIYKIIIDVLESFFKVDV